jgi:4-methyl-5(b-hydroxyethyl)-thiazole monophosphate biosynthesis
MPKILMILADGFEEIEAIAVADVLRRAGLDLTLAGLSAQMITGAHGIAVKADCLLANVNSSEMNAVVLPGGMPGAMHLRESDAVMETVKAIYNKGGIAAAICAAPIALARAGIIDGKQITAYPGFEKYLEKSDYTETLTQVDGRVITGKGPGASFEFAARIAEAFGKGEQVKTILANMFVK